MTEALSAADQQRHERMGPQHKRELGLSDAELPVTQS